MAMHPFNLELKEGESWEDVLTINATREVWAQTLAALVTQAIELASTYESARLDANNGNITAMYVTEALSDVIDKTTEALLKVSEVVKPDMAADLVKVRLAMNPRNQAHPRERH